MNQNDLVERQESEVSGIAIAPVVSDHATVSGRSSEADLRTFRPRVTTTVIGMLLIVMMIWLATMLGVTEWGMVIVAATSCFLVGTTAVIHSTLRWEHAEVTYLKERSAAQSWHKKFVQLHSESARTASVLSHMTDGVLMLSPTTEIVLINDAARKLLALSGDGTLLGRKLSELVRVPEIIQAVTRAMSENSEQSVAVEIVEGSMVRPLTVKVGRIQESDPPHLLLVLRDETDAQRVEAIRREFIANVSHELKTPLAAIKGYAETVQLAIEDDPDSAMHFVRQIAPQCQRLEDLIADMMQLARAQSGKDTLSIQVIDLANVISKAIQPFLPVAAGKQIQLDAVPCQEPALVLADEEATLTIAQNLISNALRHTETGGNVTVQCRRQYAGWLLTVQDDGAGIAEEFQERIFERFYRVDRARKTHDGGTGIGLSIVKNLTRALNGTVGVTSRPGEGATFEVWLPAPGE